MKIHFLVEISSLVKYVTFILYFYLRQCRLPAEPSYESFLEDDDDDGDDHVGRFVQILFVYRGFIYMCFVYVFTCIIFT